MKWANCCGERCAISSSPDIRIPLAAQAEGLLRALVRATGSDAIAALDGATILGERAAINAWRIGGEVSPGGGCRLYQAADNHIALNLSRAEDRALLPALFEKDFDASSDAAIAALIAPRNAGELVARGRMLGLAIACENEVDPELGAPGRCMATGARVPPPAKRAPLVVDFSALWAGPLASHLMCLAGAEVVKVESAHRPDGMREGDKAFFALLNQGKDSVALDFTSTADRAALRGLLKRADIVIEASRPRALRNLGLDADVIVRDHPGLVWLTLTAHGATGDQADWVGFGDDCGVAAGLSAMLRQASGVSGFVGDAIADPLTGLNAALIGWTAWRKGESGRYDVSLRASAQAALATARADNPQALHASLKAWAGATGAPFPDAPRRAINARVASPGADNARLLA